MNRHASGAAVMSDVPCLCGRARSELIAGWSDDWAIGIEIASCPGTVSPSTRAPTRSHSSSKDASKDCSLGIKHEVSVPVDEVSVEPFQCN
jgi:hypothetical protein